MIGMNGARESRKSMLSVQLDDLDRQSPLAKGCYYQSFFANNRYYYILRFTLYKSKLDDCSRG